MRKAFPPVALLLGLAACSPASPNPSVPADTAGFATVEEAPPYPPIVRLGPEPYVPTLADRRSRFSAQVEERHLPMLRRLKRAEMGNFGGVEWRWDAGQENDGLGRLTGVVFFRENPQQSLARYTADPLFIAAQGDFARTEQEQVARTWAERIGPDIASPGFGNMSTPWLDIGITAEEFAVRRAREGWSIPANLTLRFTGKDTLDLPMISADATDDVRVYPGLDLPLRATPDIATYDAIVLRDGCLFIDEAGDDDPLVLFSSQYGIYRDAEGFLAFRSRRSGDRARLSRVGTQMQLGYRSVVTDLPPRLVEACGKHRAVLVGTLDQAAGYGGVWFEVKRYAAREGLSEAEAMRRANACLIAQEQVLADRRLRGSDAPLPPCPPVDPAAPPAPPPASVTN